jgi:hypothetical protein
MNIKSVTQQIEGAVRAYLATDEHGVYLIPPQMQRPIIIMGPPGVGKTAVVAQVAERLGVNFVSYSITHHTRQSALGLPYIDEAEYGGRTYKVSRYTMSEIIAAAYDSMAESGVREGILFLDEVNCVSETLAPAMLQFLQYKRFGQHRLPAGWVIVCAGNPPEYNRSAREFDPAMMDRLKRVDVEPDLDVWMEYATAHGVHPAVTTYLQSKPDNFFRLRTTVDGTRMVTARGWEDLSRMLVAYRLNGLKADLDLVSQYLQDQEVAEDFSLYLELFDKYQDDYKVTGILDGTAGSAVRERAKAAPFDERIALVNLLINALCTRVRGEETTEGALKLARADFLAAKERVDGGEDAPKVLSGLFQAAHREAVAAAERGASDARQHVLAERADVLHELALLAPTGGLVAAKQAFNGRVLELAGAAKGISAQVDAAVCFVRDVFGDGEELLVFCTRLAVEPTFMRFVSAHGSEAFVEASQGLKFHERGAELLREVDELRALE